MKLLKTKIANISLFVVLLIICSCKTLPSSKSQAKLFSSQKLENEIQLMYTITEQTLKVTQKKFPDGELKSEINIDIAKGETEGVQIVFLNIGDTDGEFEIKFESDLDNENTFYPEVQLGVLGYVKIKNPSFAGFHTFEKLPDPVIPTNTFTIHKSMSQSCLLSVFVQRESKPGIYKGHVTVTKKATGEILYIPVKIKIYDVELPITPFLDTRFNPPSSFGEPFYDEANRIFSTEGNTSRYEYFMERFRINTGFKLDWSNVFETGDWSFFDSQVEERMAKGIKTFDIIMDVPWDILTDEKTEERLKFEKQFSMTNAHLKEKGWLENFIWYNFDEPIDSKLKTFNEIADWAKKVAPDIQNLTTLGWASPLYKTMQGHLNIWTPHINQYDTEFFPERQKAGDTLWIYTCVQNFYQNYPDSWKIDTHGTSQRSLGWWLFKYKASGYLYWAMSAWGRNNPWENPETFPFGNGDGSLVYPPLDRISHPYESIRLHNQRDGFEDYDFLTMLEEKVKTQKNVFTEGEIKEINKILEVSDVIPKKSNFTRDDSLMTKYHKRMLELLEK